jgi:alpha-L-fucosidase 2
MTDHLSMPNKLLTFGGGGIENVAAFHGLTEMLLQSHEGVVRLFPCWPKDQNARFGGLRTVGAFLVSSELKNGVVLGVKIVSEKGRDCTVVNPWPGRAVQLVHNGKGSSITVIEGNRFTFKTGANDTIALEPRK